MPFECVQQLAGGRLPKPYRMVIAAAGQHPARWIERYTQDRIFMPFECAQQLHTWRYQDFVWSCLCEAIPCSGQRRQFNW